MIQSFGMGWSLLIYIGLFIGVLLIFDGILQMATRKETHSDARNRRMKMIQNGATTDELMSLLRDPALAPGAGRVSMTMRLRRLLLQSGLRLGLFGFFAIVVVLSAAIFAVLSRVLEPVAAAPIAAAVAFFVPFAVVTQCKEARAKKITDQLPDALDLMARGLKVGHPLAVTVGSVAEDMADPIGSEFGSIQDQISYGDELSDAFRDFAERVGTEDARYLAVSVSIQHGTGGNLARVLQILATVIRDRHTMQKKIKAISAEGRLSGLILTFLPVFIFLSIHIATPSFYGDVMGHPMFRWAAGIMIALIVAQGLILRRLMKFQF